jgi:TPR repeat protein
LESSALEYQYPIALVQFANTELQSFRSDTTRHTTTTTTTTHGGGGDVDDDKDDDENKNTHGKTPHQYDNTVSVLVPAASTKTKIEQCLRYYRTAGELGVSDGYYNLGHILWDGIDGIIASDPDEALRMFYQAIQLGDADAMFFVGVERLGHDTEYRTDQLQKALEWIEQAGTNGHGGALHYLTVFYMNGFPRLEIVPCSEQEFQRRLTLAIEHDDNGEAHYLRGCCYYSGESSYTKDIVLSFNDFLKASELGHAEACINAGVIVFQGVPGRIDADPHHAFQLYQRGGELGSMEGWRNVVACYASGHGVQQSLEKAQYIAKTMLQEPMQQE